MFTSASHDGATSLEVLNSAKQSSTVHSSSIVSEYCFHLRNCSRRPDGSSPSVSSEEFFSLHSQIGRKRAVDLVAEPVEEAVGVDAVEAAAAGGAESSRPSSEPVAAEPRTDTAADELRLGSELRHLREGDWSEAERRHPRHVDGPEDAARSQTAEAAAAVEGLAGAGGEGGGGRRPVVEAGAGAEGGATAAQAAAG